MTKDTARAQSIMTNKASSDFINNGKQHETQMPRTASRMATRNVNKKKKSEGKLKKFFKTPKGLVVQVLIVFMLFGQLHSGQIGGLRNAGVAFVTGVVVDLIIGKLRKNKKLLPDGAMVTALIVGAVLSANAPWYQAAIIMVLALFSKHVLVLNRKPIFNPASFGLLVSLYLFHANQSWWGGLSLLPFWTLPILIIGGFQIVKKVNKFPQVFTYIGVYFLLFVLMTVFHYKDVSAVYRVPLINTTLFLSFIMLTDPPTSPAKYRHQILFGIIAAVVSVAFYTVFGGLAYPLIGLLAANAWKAWKFRNPERVPQKYPKRGPSQEKGKMAQGLR